MYGLRIPGDSSRLGYSKKPTMFAGTMPQLTKLGSRCTGDHAHVPVLGGVKLGGKWTKRSSLVGHYPSKLCLAYAKVFESAFAWDAT